MAYLDHIRTCNTHDLAGFRPLWTGGHRVGWVRHRLAEMLAQHGDPAFQVTADRIDLCPATDDFLGRTAAVAKAAARLVLLGVIRKLRREQYPVMARWGTPPLLQIDRGAVPAFGVGAFGLHINGYVRMPDGSLEMWVGRRARDRMVAPGKFDNLVAGGQPIKLTLRENLIKEAQEEAGIGPDLASFARPAGAITYCMETPEGLKPDTIFVYDLELPLSFRPRNEDGEVECFERWPLARVAAVVRDSSDFKFNCNLVILDFLLRHGFLCPDTEPDYCALAQGLRAAC